MSYEVLARKWRPGRFADVVGQDHVTHTLENALKSERVAHSYLFVGPRGTGKTSIARIFAKALNCVEGPTITPCGKCSSCKEISSGTNMDVHEIDGASNRGIDDIKSLRDTIKYVSNARYRIYIIDEVHMLTTEAFNALLKTLEEPPPHIIFLFATTEPHKIPMTILSRCQRFDLRRISVKLLTERLALIAQSEGIEVDENVLLALARAAEGSLRDAESGLDQLISFKGKSIQENDVLSVFGLVSRQAMEDLSFAVLRNDVVSLIRLVEDFDRQGKDMQRLLIELLEHFLQLLVFIEGGQDAVASDVAPFMVNILKQQAELSDVNRLLRIAEILVETNDRVRYALSKKTMLDAALIKCARASTMVSLDSILAQLKELKNGLPESGASTQREPVCQTVQSRSAQTPSSKTSVKPKNNTPSNDDKNPDRSEAEDLASLKKDWKSILEHVGRMATLVKNLLLDAMPVAVKGDVVTIGVDREFSDRLEQLDMPRNKNTLQKALSASLDRSVSVDFQLTDISGLDADSSGDDAAKETVNENPSASESSHKWIKNETVRKTLDLFNGSIVHVKE